MVNLNNGLMYEFGMDENDIRNESKIKEKIQEIDETFDLILIKEYFNESLVLLKHKLCWSYEDLATFKLNVHEETSKTVISKEAREKLRAWLDPSYKLYEHFKVKTTQFAIYCSKMLKHENYFRQNLWTKPKHLEKIE